MPWKGKASRAWRPMVWSPWMSTRVEVLQASLPRGVGFCARSLRCLIPSNVNGPADHGCFSNNQGAYAHPSPNRAPNSISTLVSTASSAPSIRDSFPKVTTWLSGVLGGCLGGRLLWGGVQKWRDRENCGSPTRRPQSLAAVAAVFPS